MRKVSSRVEEKTIGELGLCTETQRADLDASGSWECGIGEVFKRWL